MPLRRTSSRHAPRLVNTSFSRISNPILCSLESREDVLSFEVLEQMRKGIWALRNLWSAEMQEGRGFVSIYNVPLRSMRTARMFRLGEAMNA